MFNLRYKILIALISGWLLPLLAEQIAFPGAEGFGRFASGGRGGAVIAVTNTNDSGPGSLRAALEEDGPRTIVFRVSGTIFLESTLDIENGNVTIAGQTAPGDGITLANYTLSVEANNVIIRFIRSRLGDRHEQEADAFEARYTQNVIIDHCSFSWGVDETASAYNNKDFTMQWCVVSEALHNSVHSKGNHGYGGIWGGKNASFHHNLLAHCRSRMPRFNGARYDDYVEWGDGQVDHRHNVIYNWSTNSAYGAEPNASGFKPQYNLVGNVYKPGPATPSGSKSERIIDPGMDGSTEAFSEFFLWGNYVFNSPEVSRNNWAGVDFEPIINYREDWELLRFNRDEDGDGELDIFENYDGIEIDPMFGVEKLPRFDISRPHVLLIELRQHRVPLFEELPEESRERVKTWYGYYEEAGAVLADGTPYKSDYGRVHSDSALALQLRIKGPPLVTLEDLRMDEPFPVEGSQPYFPALEAYEQVLAHAGASFPCRDSVDTRIISDVRDGTFTHGNNGHIDSQTEVGGYPELNSEPAPVDTDEDGMPDEWEVARGLDPEDPEDRNGDANGNGYTNLEDYLNGLVADHFPSAYSASYANWAEAAFWDDDSMDGLQDDPDGDGWKNALEYAFASDPLREDIQETVGPEIVMGSSYEFNYRRGANLRFQVLSTTDLESWSMVWDSGEASVDGQKGIHTAHHVLEPLPEPDEGKDLQPLFWKFTVSEGKN